MIILQNESKMKATLGQKVQVSLPKAFQTSKAQNKRLVIKGVPIDIVLTHVVTLTHVGTSVYLGQTHLGTPLQVPAWIRKFSLGSTGDEISSLIIIQGLFAQQKFEY